MKTETRTAVVVSALVLTVATWAAFGSPVPGFNRVTAPLVARGTTISCPTCTTTGSGGALTFNQPLSETGSVVSIRASSSSQSGSMSAVQSSDLAFLLLPTPTPSPADPLVFYGGKIQSTGIPATYLADTFTRANSTDISGTAAQTGGTWTGRDSASQTMGVISNALYRTGANPGIGTLYSETSHTDGIAQMTINVDAAAGLLVRWAPGANFNAATGLTLWYENTCLRYGTFSGGSASQITALDCSLTAFPHTIKITYSGNDLEFFLDGVSEGTASNATYASQTQAGIWMSSASGASRVVDYSVASPAVPKSLQMVGNYDNGTDFAYLTLGEDGGPGFNVSLPTGGGNGVRFDDGTGDNSFFWGPPLFSVNSATDSFTWDPATGELATTGYVTAPQLMSTIAIGTPPLVVTSTTKVDNLNADLLDGLDSTAFLAASTPLYLEFVSTRNVTNTSANANPIVLRNTITPVGCIAEVQAVGSGGGTCSYALFDVTATTALCTVSLACNASSGSTGTCSASGSAASGHTIAIRETSPSAGDTSSAFVVMSCSY